MNQLYFDWDSHKNLTNKKKHGISFEKADHSESEDRFILMGLSERFRVLVVCHCYRECETLIRIISARKADRHEIKQYERYL